MPKDESTRSKTGQTRHTKSHEQPLPLYVAFSIHGSTRSKTLINKMYHLGLSVSYQRILELEESLATSISEIFEKDGYVAPACLRKGIFTIDALITWTTIQVLRQQRRHFMALVSACFNCLPRVILARKDHQ